MDRVHHGGMKRTGYSATVFIPKKNAQRTCWWASLWLLRWICNNVWHIFFIALQVFLLWWSCLTDSLSRGFISRSPTLFLRGWRARISWWTTYILIKKNLNHLPTSSPFIQERGCGWKKIADTMHRDVEIIKTWSTTRTGEAGTTAATALVVILIILMNYLLQHYHLQCSYSSDGFFIAVEEFPWIIKGG